MAKKRKVKDEQERGFQVPEFDRDEYVRKEVRDARTTLVTLGYAFLFAMFSFSVALYGPQGVSAGILLGFGGMFTLRWFLGLAGIRVNELEKKHVLGFSLLFLLTWLAVWVVLSNPPASDISPPMVRSIEVIEAGDNWTAADPVRAGEEYRVYARVLDLGEIGTVTLRIDPATATESYEMTEDPWREGWYYAEVTFRAGTRSLDVTAEDDAGNEGSLTRTIHVSE